MRGLPRTQRLEFAGVAMVAAMAACGGSGEKTKGGARSGKAKVEAPANADQRGPGKGGKGSPDPDGSAAAAGWSWALPKGLHAPPEVPADNPITPEKVALGHRLFMDKRLSVDGSRSCYSCHQNELGNADGREKALGAGDKPLPRNTPTIWNVAYHGSLYWDGRAPSLEAQALGALKGGNMGLGDTLPAKAAQIGARPEYAEAFRKAFGLGADDPVTPEHVAQAISSYERTLLCGDTKHDTQTLDEAAQRGWKLFMGKAACITCHAGDNLSDGLFHRTGIGVPPKGEAADEADRGRGKVTKKTEDDFTFRTPTLRNVARTAPYFHDGSAKTLEDAVGIMASGGLRDRGPVDDKLLDRQLTETEIADLVAFLKSLDCPGELETIGDQTVASIP